VEVDSAAQESAWGPRAFVQRHAHSTWLAIPITMCVSITSEEVHVCGGQHLLDAIVMTLCFRDLGHERARDRCAERGLAGKREESWGYKSGHPKAADAQILQVSLAPPAPSIHAQRVRTARILEWLAVFSFSIWRQ
jgi:hypothetical protein